MPDSYDQLARSIERVLRSELPPPASEQQLATAIDRLMGEQARNASLRIARLRAVVVTPFVLLPLAEAVSGASLAPFPVGRPAGSLSAAVCATWLVIALTLALALGRGWYRRWVPHLMPGLDALLIVAGFVAPLQLPGGERPLVALLVVAALCAFVGISGGLRLSRFSSRLATALSTTVFLLGAAAAGLPPLIAVAVAGCLVATSLLTSRMVALVRQLVIDEVSRATLKQMFDEAKASLAAREQVLKMVSHDLRNPLSTVKMGTEVLLEIPFDPERQKEHLRRIRRAGDRMERLVLDLLDVFKLDKGHASLAASEIEVEPLLREAHEQLEPLAAEHELTLELECPPGLPRIVADSGRVLQVLSNLVGNAIKFTPKQGRIAIRAKAAAGGVQFSVSDTGPGIPEDQLGRLFHDLWQADPADKRGIGLGLTIARGFIDAHGGRLWVESRLGEGTTFHFVLGGAVPAPVAPAARPTRETKAARSR